jgi:hypothetical protein
MNPEQRERAMKGSLKLDELNMPKIPEYNGIQKKYLRQFDEDKIDPLDNTSESLKSINFEQMKQNLLKTTEDDYSNYPRAKPSSQSMYKPPPPPQVEYNQPPVSEYRQPNYNDLINNPKAGTT